MPKEYPRFMRLLVFFDLPVKTKDERKIASQFRKFLLSDGYIMLQLSVYSRVCRGVEAAEKHTNRLMANLPEQGCIRMLQITEQQYARMKILVGKEKRQEGLKVQQLLLF